MKSLARSEKETMSWHKREDQYVEIRQDIPCSAVRSTLLVRLSANALPGEAPLEEEGEVLLYVQPFAQDADRLRFRIESISARKSDGTEFPVSVRLAELKVGR